MPEPDNRPALTGQTFAGRYQVEHRLGAGGMGTVYVARQIAMDRRVALKVLNPTIAASEQAAKRFHREMQATARVEHQNTIRVYDFGESDGQLFLAMELLDGCTLAAAITDSGPMPVARVVHIGTQIARALGAAHSEGIVHRDLKPDNVMLLDRYGERDFVKVLDFGIARMADAALDATTQLTAAGSIVGTPVYMSPEQSMGQAVDSRSDLYSLGIVLYHMATGTVPFTDPTPLRVLFMHVQDAPPAPSSMLAGGVQPALEAVILHLLAKDPARRPQTAAEVVRLLAMCATDTLDDAVAPTARVANVHAAVTVDAEAPIDGDTAAALPAVTVDGETWAGKPLQVPASPQQDDVFAPTRSKRWWLALPVIAAAAAAFMWPRPAAPPQHEPSPRSRMDAVWTAAHDPLPPAGCACEDPALLTKLADAGQKLSGGKPGGKRAADVAALQTLESLGAQTCAEFLVVLARARLYASDPEKVLSATTEALRTCPRDAVAQLLAGTALTLQGRAAEGAAAFQRAVAESPDYTAPAFNLGLLAVARKNGTEALRIFTQLQTREPDRGDVMYGLGHALALSGRQEEAVAAWCKARALGMAEAAPLCPLK